jgi:hypothetical protein
MIIQLFLGKKSPKCKKKIKKCEKHVLNLSDLKNQNP